MRFLEIILLERGDKQRQRAGMALDPHGSPPQKFSVGLNGTGGHTVYSKRPARTVAKHIPNPLEPPAKVFRHSAPGEE